jgi:hypothetical protein
MVAMCAGAEVILSNPTSVPAENIAISQLKTDGVVLQSRHTKPTDWKGIGQSFKWESGEALDGIGLFISPEQANASPAYTRDQHHVLIIQELDGYRGVPGKTVYQVEFTLRAENVKPGQWLHLDIQNLALKNRQYYGITLVPAEASVSSQRISWATTADAASYASGDVNQMDIPGRGLPPGNGIAFGSAKRDAAFYLQLTAKTGGGGVGTPLILGHMLSLMGNRCLSGL